MRQKAFVLIAALAACLSASAQAIIKFDKTVINFGTFPEKKPQYCEFTFKNTGDKPLVIQQAYGSCGCTVPSIPKDPIEPGGRGVIKVSYNGKRQYEGYFKKLITVRSNAANSVVRVYIEGTMKAE